MLANYQYRKEVYLMWNIKALWVQIFMGERGVERGNFFFFLFSCAWYLGQKNIQEKYRRCDLPLIGWFKR